MKIRVAVAQENETRPTSRSSSTTLGHALGKIHLTAKIHAKPSSLLHNSQEMKTCVFLVVLSVYISDSSFGFYGSPEYGNMLHIYTTEYQSFKNKIKSRNFLSNGCN